MIQTTDQATTLVYEVEFYVPDGCYPYARDVISNPAISVTDGLVCAHDFGPVLDKSQSNLACWDPGFIGGVYNACSADDSSVGTEILDTSILTVD